MSYNPSLPSSASAMSLLQGVQSTTNASPSTKSLSAPWVTLPPTTNDGVSFSAPVLVRGFVSLTQQARGRIGDNNDSANYKEQAGVCVYPYGTASDLYEEVSDDELIFYRSSAATIKIVAMDEWTSAQFPGISFGGGYTRFTAMRLGS